MASGSEQYTLLHRAAAALCCRWFVGQSVWCGSQEIRLLGTHCLVSSRSSSRRSFVCRLALSGSRLIRRENEQTCRTVSDLFRWRLSQREAVVEVPVPLKHRIAVRQAWEQTDDLRCDSPLNTVATAQSQLRGTLSHHGIRMKSINFTCNAARCIGLSKPWRRQ